MNTEGAEASSDDIGEGISPSKPPNFDFSSNGRALVSPEDVKFDEQNPGFEENRVPMPTYYGQQQQMYGQ